MIRNVTVAVDGSDHALRAVDLASEIAAQFKARLHLVHVVHHVRLSEEFAGFAEEERAGAEDESAMMKGLAGLTPALFGPTHRPIALTDEMMTLIAEKALAPARERAAAKGVKEVHEEVLKGDPAHEILEYIDSAGIDIIFAGRRGLSSLEGLVLGSVTTKLCSHSKKPVVTIV